MTDAYIAGVPWPDAALHLESLSKVTKQDVMDFANTYLNDNYVAVNKLMGERDPYKVDKPAITKVELNRDTMSDFHATWEVIETGRFEPQFIDYANEIEHGALNSGIEVNYVENQTNPLFQLAYVLDMGSHHDRDLALAVEYLTYLGTDSYSAAELQQEFFKLGVSFNVNVGQDRVYVSLSGLEESFAEGVELFEHLLSSVQPDEEAYLDMVDGIMKERDDAKLSKWAIFGGRMGSYARYGANNPANDVISEEELMGMDVNQLIEKIKSITSYEHYIYYYGQNSIGEVVTVLDDHHTTPETLMGYPEEMEYPELETTENKVYFVNYDMVQSEIMS